MWFICMHNFVDTRSFGLCRRDIYVVLPYLLSRGKRCSAERLPVIHNCLQLCGEVKNENKDTNVRDVAPCSATSLERSGNCTCFLTVRLPPVGLTFFSTGEELIMLCWCGTVGLCEGLAVAVAVTLVPFASLLAVFVRLELKHEVAVVVVGWTA